MLNDEYIQFGHRQVKKTDTHLISKEMLVPHTVIRRNLDLPIIMGQFRINALKHANFFHKFLMQDISYKKEDRHLPEINRTLLKRFQ